MTCVNSPYFSRFDFNKIESLIWDWNGTLLDDVEVNVKVINRMLSRRGLNLLDTAAYKELFCFPVQSFQRQVGFDFEKESIEEISAEYHATYKLYEHGIRLNPDAFFILDSLNERGKNQYILSAARQKDLQEMLAGFNIAGKFKSIYGASDMHATGKTETAKRLMREHGLNPAETLMIGDTLHDADVAGLLGVHCLLYSGGHNSYDLLIKRGKVIAGLKEIMSL